ncbi:hypothetical protein K440DRAFT_632274 [Wilcoxina mikolae CBS 423.85]|nr:hypothetical protein K440DRAFT_632274 [Wilcoxina mikolae CBS 423.85]
MTAGLWMTGLKGKMLMDNVLPAWQTPKTSDFAMVIETLESQSRVSVLSVIWMATRFIIMVPIGLPGMIMGLLAT